MRSPQRYRRMMILAAFVPFLAGCPRGVSVQSEPGPAYALEVENPLAQPMLVSYDDGTGVRLLGTVPASGRMRFIVSQPVSLRLTVTATDERRMQTVTRTVTLQAGQITEVSLRP